MDFRWLDKVTLTNPFPTMFAGEITNEIVRNECYSFIDDFSGYNQVPIAKEDQHRTTYVCEFGSFSYKVMRFGLKNEPTIFFKIVLKYFQENLYKTIEIYFDDWTIYILLKEHAKWITLMLEICKKIQLSLNIKKCIFSTPIGILLVHVVYKEGIKVDLSKINIIIDLNLYINLN